MVRRLLVMAALMALVLGGGFVPQRVEAGPPYARITVHAATCPVTTRRVFETCHANHAVGVTFEIAGKPKTTDASGMATGAPGAGARSVRVSIGSYAPYSAQGSYVYCTNQVTGKVLFAGRTGRSIMITTTANQLTICDWYLLHTGSTPPTPTPSPTASPSASATLEA